MDHDAWLRSQSSTSQSRSIDAQKAKIREERAKIVEITSAHAKKREVGLTRILKKKQQKSAKASQKRPAPKLEVFVVACRDLPKMDMLLGKCDGYVKVSVGTAEKKTKVVIRNYHPVFDQRFVFEVPPLCDSVTFSVWDYDMVGSDESVFQRLFSGDAGRRSLSRIAAAAAVAATRGQVCAPWRADDPRGGAAATRGRSARRPRRRRDARTAYGRARFSAGTSARSPSRYSRRRRRAASY